MKISKSLLSAIVIGIVVQATTTSCTKEKGPNDAKAKQEAKKTEENKNSPNYPANCPACGMG
jgi:hypothetical protein